MKIESIHIENFRGFHDEEISLDDYTCFVGSNGSGKSTILHALNVFFRQFKDVGTDLSRLSEDDYHHKDISKPIRITVTFSELTDAAKEDLRDYVRQDKLIVSAEAEFDPVQGVARVRQFGSRLGMEEFRCYFQGDKEGKSANELKEIFKALREQYTGIGAATSKAAMATSLQEYERANPSDCVLIPSEDQFYGATKGANKLAPHLQWIFVSASKDVSEEAEESKNSGLGQLLARTIRSRVDFSSKIVELREEAKTRYQGMLDAEQEVLNSLSESLQARLRSFAHSGIDAKVQWQEDPDKSIRVEEPLAGIQLGERGFISDLARFGHGLQRSYLLALLQEVSSYGSDSDPTLVMGIEEPELYQHPPQARYLASVLRKLTEVSGQVLCCTHSPVFIPGDGFESVRVVRESGTPSSSATTQVKYSELAADLDAAGDRLLTESGLMAKLSPELNSVISEMFFSQRLILVEGLEDQAYLSAYIELCGLGEAYREAGCHIVPAGGKSSMAKPLAIAKRLGIPVFVLFDADTHVTNEQAIPKHKKDNLVLQNLLECAQPEEWPQNNIEGSDFYIWSEEMTKVLPGELGDQWQVYKGLAEERYGHPGSLTKNPIAIAFALEKAWDEGVKSESLESLVNTIKAWAS